MRIITRTIYGNHVQTSLALQTKWEMLPNTTLNEKLDILSGSAPADGVTPEFMVMTIGNNGHRIRTRADGIPMVDPVPHATHDAGHFHQMPFILRELDNDLTVAQRERYALRRLETRSGTQYIAYYGKRLDLKDIVPKMFLSDQEDGQDNNPIPFVPTNDNLNPEHPEIPNDGIVQTNGQYLFVSALITLEMTEEDVAEFINVSRIVYGDELSAIVSEIGLCTAVNRVSTGQGGGGGTFNYNEVIACQIGSHITGYWSVGYSNKGFQLEIDAGAGEPLLGPRLVQ